MPMDISEQSFSVNRGARQKCELHNMFPSDFGCEFDKDLCNGTNATFYCFRVEEVLGLFMMDG